MKTPDFMLYQSLKIRDTDLGILTQKRTYICNVKNSMTFLANDSLSEFTTY